MVLLPASPTIVTVVLVDPEAAQIVDVVLVLPVLPNPALRAAVTTFAKETSSPLVPVTVLPPRRLPRPLAVLFVVPPARLVVEPALIAETRVIGDASKDCSYFYKMLL